MLDLSIAMYYNTATPDLLTAREDHDWPAADVLRLSVELQVAVRPRLIVLPSQVTVR